MSVFSIKLLRVIAVINQHQKIFISLFCFFVSSLYLAGASVGTNELDFPGVSPAWRAVQKINMQSLPWEEDEWSSDDFYYCLTRMLHDQLNPSEHRKRKSAFKIINQRLSALAPAAVDVTPRVVRDRATWQDLEFFCGKNPEAGYVAQSLVRTTSELGKASSYYLLSQVCDDENVLTHKQKIIRYFLDNPELAEKLRICFEQLACYENGILSFWSRDWFEQSSRSRFYNVPGFDWLNDSRYALLLKNLVGHSTRIYQTVGCAIAAGVLTGYGLAELCSVDNAATVLEPQADRRKVGGPLVDYAWDKSGKKLRGVIALLGGIYTGLQLKESATWIRDCFYLEQCLQMRLLHVARYFEQLEAINRLLVENAALQALLPESKQVTALFDPASDSGLRNFMELLRDENLGKEPSLLANRGAILLAYKTMHALKDDVVPVLSAVSELEAYLGLATLYKERKQNKYPVCFVEYCHNDEPELTLVNFVHPLISADNVVPNSITLGGRGVPTHALVTGPNAGGKSTVIKALMANVLLGQSVGITLAEKASWRLFSNVATYLNITDDIQQGNSLFKAEVLRTHELLDTLKKMPSGKLSLLAFDEIFNGTTPLEGQAAAYSVTKHLCNQPGVMALVATHFYALTELEATTGTITNYHVSASLAKDGRISYPFKLERGISNQHIAFDILHNEGIESGIVDEARAFMRAHR